MVVESNLHLGEGIVRGDQFSIRRTIKGLSPGVTVSEAYLTLKSGYSVADPGLFQKAIDTSNTVGTGQVEDIGSSGIAVIRFDLLANDTLLMVAETPYYFDIQIKLSDDSIITIEHGTTSAEGQVTTSS